MNLNAQCVNRFDEKLKKSGGLKLNGIRIKPENNACLFDIKLTVNKSNTEIINKGIELVYKAIRNGEDLGW